MAVTDKLKSACAKTGIALMLIFAFRTANDLLLTLMGRLLSGADPVFSYYLLSGVSIALLYIGCPLATAAVFGFKKESIPPLFRKTTRLGKAVSWIVPTYGAGQLINFTVLFISFILAENKNAIVETYSPITSGGEYSVSTAVFVVIQLSVLAPVFEEIWFRGIIQTSLSPVGNGFAIMLSSLCFAFAHGNVHQFCFTFVVGIILGYVRYAANSIIPTMIIHCIMNSVAASVMLFANSGPVTSAVEKTMQGIELDALEKTMITAFGVFFIVLMIFIVAGMFSAVLKLKNNRLYRPVNNYPDATKSQKLAALCTQPLFIAGALLCVGYIGYYILF